MPRDDGLYIGHMLDMACRAGGIRLDACSGGAVTVLSPQLEPSKSAGGPLSREVGTDCFLQAFVHVPGKTPFGARREKR